MSRLTSPITAPLIEPLTMAPRHDEGLDPVRDTRRRLKAERPFGAWLLGQRGRCGYIGDLAGHAAQDRRFPKHGSARDVRAHVFAQAIDEDMRGALDDAITEWDTMIANAVRQTRRAAS